MGCNEAGGKSEAEERMCFSLLDRLSHVNLVLADLVKRQRACKDELFHDVLKHVGSHLHPKIDLAVRCPKVRRAVDDTSQPSSDIWVAA